MHHSLTHVFNVELAQKYGLDEAILIHHFQFWISFNKNQGSNFKEGKTWTFQTRKQMAALFPYWDHNHIRRLCESLVQKGVLETSNFNKRGFDRTLWYAFVNEEQMIGNSKKPYERQNCQMEKANLPHAFGKSATPIPDTKQDTKQDIVLCSSPPVAALEPWEKIEKEDLKGNKFSVCRYDLVERATASRKDWDLEEIIEVWKIFVHHKGPISDWFSFCEGCINKLRRENSFKKLGEKQCHQKKESKERKHSKPTSENTNEKISAIDMMKQPFLNCKLDRRGIPILS